MTGQSENANTKNITRFTSGTNAKSTNHGE